MDEQQQEREPVDLLIAGLLGAALGAGIGLLVMGASRGHQPSRGAVIARAAGRVRRRAMHAFDDVPSVRGVASATKHVVEDARRTMERAVERELRDMQRAMRRRRRELGL